MKLKLDEMYFCFKNIDKTVAILRNINIIDLKTIQSPEIVFLSFHLSISFVRYGQVVGGIFMLQS